MLNTINAPAENTFSITAPNGNKINIPVSYEPATDVYDNLKDAEAIKEYYDTNGYVVVRDLIPKELCDKAKEFFKQEIKPYKGYIYRQASANPEKNIITPYNYILNSVMNLQDLNIKKFPGFRLTSLEILTHTKIRSILQILMKRESILVQTMFFEGNPATWPHQDKDYLDAIEPGTMVAAWIAVEDIQPGAGRFYIYPKSHKIDIEKIGKNLNIILDREAYKKLVIDTINENKLECRAPALKKGDVLFWHGKTIHGSLQTAQPQFSRSSFTGHYIPASKAYLQLQVRKKKLKIREVNGMNVNFPKDQNLFINKAIFFIETSFPKLFRKAKKKAINLFSK